MNALSTQQITIAGTPLTPTDETAHTLIVGGISDGAKSIVFREMLSCLTRRGDRAVVAHPAGYYFEEFYSTARGDTVLNPSYPEGPKWHIFSELNDGGDVEQLARAIAATTQFPGDTTYTDNVRYLIASILFRMRTDGVNTNGEFLRRVEAIRQENLAMYVSPEAAAYLINLQSNFFEGIRFGAHSALEALADVQKQQGPAFSIRNWVAHGRGLLFMPHSSNSGDPKAALIAVWLRLVMSEIARQTNPGQPLWLFVDSLCTIARIESLSTALQTLGPSGGRGVFSVSDYLALARLYSLDSYALPLRCGNKMVFQCSGETACLGAALINGTVHY